MSKLKIKPSKSVLNSGCQGWNYNDWITKADGKSVFYPRGTRTNEMLEIYSKAFDSIEVDSTFYAIPAASVIESWYKKTPDDFTFSLKMPQEITHEYVLREPSFVILEEFCERILLLKEKLGAVLIQLAPTFDATKENAQALRDFLEQLPKTIHFAVEFRNREWLVDWTFEELEKNNVALCATEGSWIPRELMFRSLEKVKNDFAYIRFMGERDLTSFAEIVRPQNANLQIWAEEISKIESKEIFVYFSNFYEGFAPASANKLKELFNQKIVKAEELENQGSLF